MLLKIPIESKKRYMRTFFIDAKVEDDIFIYWTAYNDSIYKTKISELISHLEGSERLNVGDTVSIQFDTKSIPGFERDLQEDYNAYNFKLDHKKFTYGFFYSNDKVELEEEYVLIPIPKNIND